MNEQGETAGYIQRTYVNGLARLLDIAMDGNLFTDYSIMDGAGNVRLKVKQVRAFLKRRQYIIHYEGAAGTSIIHLVDKKRLDLGEKTSFEFDQKSYELNKPLMDWGEIKLEGKVVARWKETLTIPPKASFRLEDPSHEQHLLLLLGIFHAYLHSPK